MSALTLDDAMAHLNVANDDDENLIQNKIDAAETWIGLFLGAAISTFNPLPEPILEATRQLVAHLYNNREASLIGTNIVENCPGMFDLLAPYREYVF
jgi:hypothetical protein